MKIIISVGGEFHAFHLANQLERRGYLDRLITSYPYFKVSKNGLPRKKIISLCLKEILEKLYHIIPLSIKPINLQYYLASIFDYQASRSIRPCDIFVGWSGFSLKTLYRAKSYGAVTIVERGSTHIEYQRDILRDEYERLGIKPNLPDSRIVEKELEEYQVADYISIPSRFVKMTFLEKGIPENKLIHVPYGVDVDIFRPIPKEDAVFRVIYVGAMTLRKGLHYLLRAVGELNLKNFEIWLIGKINDEIRPFFKKYKDKFKYLGPVDYQKLYKYYSCGSVFVLPSIEEGLSLVLLQALACGLPVICTFNSGGADVICEGRQGFIIPTGDVPSIKEKILYLYEHPDICQEMARQARQRVRREFTWDHYGQKMVNAYFNILR